MTKLKACDIPFSAYDFPEGNLTLNITTEWLFKNVNLGDLCPTDGEGQNPSTFDTMNFFECLGDCVEVKQAIFEQIWTGDNRDQLHAISIDNICSKTSPHEKINVMFANHPSEFWNYDWCQKEHCSREGVILGLMVITLFSFASRVGSYFEIKDDPSGKIGTHRFSNIYLIVNMLVISAVVYMYWFFTSEAWLEVCAIFLVIVNFLILGVYCYNIDAKEWMYPMHRFGLPLLISIPFLLKVIFASDDDYNQATNMLCGIYLTSFLLFFLPPILQWLIYCVHHRKKDDAEPSCEKYVNIAEFFFLGVHILLMIYMWLIAIESKPYVSLVPYLATVLVIVANVPEFLKLKGVVPDQSSREAGGKQNQKASLLQRGRTQSLPGGGVQGGFNKPESTKAVFGGSMSRPETNEGAQDGMNKCKCFKDYWSLIVSVLLFFVLVVVGTIYAICEIFHFHGSGQFIGSFSFTLAVLYAMTPMVIN